ncbi:hypothetical protein ACO9S2_05645 [Nitrospira sp. NS4]|uniref:hypothetical protein n=1 Tax=Nitrospira sp. NS4 TaxID=3414498 RepID=UPI003C2D045A
MFSRTACSLHVVLLTTSLSLSLTSLAPAPVQAAPRGGGKTEVLPAQKAAPAAVFIETVGTESELRRQLRLKNGVMEMKAESAQVRFSEAPLNSFGFVPQQGLGMALVTQSPDVMLNRVAPAANAYEIHKLADGSAMVVGFVGPDLKPQLTPQLRPKNVRLALYSNPSDKAPHIVAVPLGKLAVDQMPHRVDPKNPNGPVVFEMDLQSSANRQSPHGGQ